MNRLRWTSVVKSSKTVSFLYNGQTFCETESAEVFIKTAERKKGLAMAVGLMSGDVKWFPVNLRVRPVSLAVEATLDD